MSLKAITDISSALTSLKFWHQRQILSQIHSIPGLELRRSPIQVLMLMQVFHWSQQAGNCAFFESRDQCLHDRSGSVASSRSVGKSR